MTSKFLAELSERAQGHEKAKLMPLLYLIP